MQKEYSEMPAVAWRYDCYWIPETARIVRKLYGKLTDELPESDSDWEVSNVEALIVRPPKTTEGEIK